MAWQDLHLSPSAAITGGIPGSTGTSTGQSDFQIVSHADTGERGGQDRIGRLRIRLAWPDPPKAIQAAREALDLATHPDCGYAWGEADAAQAWGEAYFANNERELARRAFTRALEVRRPLTWCTRANPNGDARVSKRSSNLCKLPGAGSGEHLIETKASPPSNGVAQAGSSCTRSRGRRLIAPRGVSPCSRISR